MNFIINLLKQFFYIIGSTGPLILIFLSIYLLNNKTNLLFYYIIGIFFNSILNLLLKGIIKQPRPSEDIAKFKLAIQHGERFIFKNGIPHDIFGMPSGHSQSCLFSTTFIYLSLKKTNILYIYFIISLITIIQRVVYNYHTILQVIIGSIIGCYFSVLFYYLAQQQIKGIIREKLDDYAPI